MSRPPKNHNSQRFLEILHQIGVNVRSIREDLGLSQAELARRAKVSSTTLNEIETRQIAISVYRRSLPSLRFWTFPFPISFRGQTWTFLGEIRLNFSKPAKPFLKSFAGSDKRSLSPISVRLNVQMPPMMARQLI